MFAFITRRVMQSVVTLLIASIAVYGAMQLVPGDPVYAMFFPNVPSGERLESIREQLGLNDPFIVRYWNWLKGCLRGDFGKSFKQNREITEILSQHIPPSIKLAIAGLVVSVVLGITGGVIAGVTENYLVDNAVMFFALIGISAPSFWLGLILMLVFSLYLGWLPTSGTGGIAHLILPAFTLGFWGAGYLARFTRNSVLEVKHREYVTTARSKGLSEMKVTTRHILRNALIAVITMTGLLMGYYLGGAVIVETVFGRPGVGHQLVNAISSKDFPVVQSLMIITVSAFIFLNLIIDISYAYIDPRIRYN